MDISEIQNIIRNVKKSLFKNFNPHALGIMRFNLKGMGIQFKDHKIYSHGDDIRFIDWKILAKTNIPYSKSFDQERNIEILIFIDASCSMQIGYKGTSKLQVALDIAFLLYLLTQETKDKIHTVILGEQIIDIPKSSGNEGLIYLISKLKKLGIIDVQGKVSNTYHPVSDMTEDDKIKALLKIGLKRKQIILLSDFFNFIPKSSLYSLLYQQNIFAFKIVSPLDDLSKYPFGVFGYKANKSFSRAKAVFTKRNNDILELKLENKLKKIRVENKYLEEFLREIAK